ncbi:MAG TPA: hypothetical protein VND64_14115 [Pirellulales bacterium]|nr:hypothetical protein [Pirellulales bacterium]
MNCTAGEPPRAEPPQLVEGDTFSVLDFAFEIRRPSEDWEFWDENKVRQVNGSACMGMADLKKECMLLVVPERSGSTDLAGYAKLLLSAMQVKPGSQPEQKRVELAGKAALQIKVAAVSQEISSRYLIYLVEHEGFIYQVNAWTNDALFAENEERLVRAAERLTTSLRRDDPDNVVGATFSLRAGVYRDFESGFSFRKPAGLWTAKAGDQARQQHAAARLLLSERASGTAILVIPETIPNLKHDDYHRLLLRRMQAAPNTPVRRVPLGDLEVQVSRFDRRVKELEFTYVLITSVRDQRHVQLLVYGLRPNMSRIDERLNDIISGLKVPRQPETARLDAANALTDVRLGFSLSVGDTGGKAIWAPLPRTDAIGSQATLTARNLEYFAQGICIAEGLFEELAIKGALTRLADLGFDLTTRQNLDDSLCGLPAKQIFLAKGAGPRDLVSLWVARRANTVYVFMASESQVPNGQGDPMAMRTHKIARSGTRVLVAIRSRSH